MELRQNMHRTTTRPKAWVAAILVALALGLMGWYALAHSVLTHPASVLRPPVTTADSLLDRNAERQLQGPILRDGGPGGQFGFAP